MSCLNMAEETSDRTSEKMLWELYLVHRNGVLPGAWGDLERRVIYFYGSGERTHIFRVYGSRDLRNKIIWIWQESRYFFFFQRPPPQPPDRASELNYGITYSKIYLGHYKLN